MPSALKAALRLHPPVERDNTMSIEQYRIANIARMSLLNDSWPHKLHALRTHFQLPVFDKVMPLSDEELVQHEAIITEEWVEFWQALFRNDMLEVLDGGLDLIVTVLSLLTHMGFPPAVINACFEEIHAANLTKVDDNGKPVFINGKYQKTSNYTKPNLPEAAKTVPPFLPLFAELESPNAQHG